MIIGPSLSCIHWLGFVYTECCHEVMFTQNAMTSFARASNWVNDTTSYFLLQSKFCVQSTTKKILKDNYCETIYEPVRIDRSSYRASIGSLTEFTEKKKNLLHFSYFFEKVQFYSFTACLTCFEQFQLCRIQRKDSSG